MKKLKKLLEVEETMGNLYQDRSPDDWKKGNDVTDQQQTEALAFMLNLRGRYIMGRAMYEIIHKLEQETGAMREASDLRDYRYIRDSLFYIFPDDLYNEKALQIKEFLNEENDNA